MDQQVLQQIHICHTPDLYYRCFCLESSIINVKTSTCEGHLFD